MSMRDLFSTRPDDYDMGKQFRSAQRQMLGAGFIRAQKRATRRASRHHGARRAIAQGIEEALASYSSLEGAEIAILTLAKEILATF